MVRLYFWSILNTYVWQEDIAKIFKVPGAPRNVNPARAITWQLSVTIYCTVFRNNSPPSTSLVFTLKNSFEKKIYERWSLNKLLNLD